MELINKAIAMRDEMDKAFDEFMKKEIAERGVTEAQAAVTGHDIIYKYLWHDFKEDIREALTDIPHGEHWQASDGVVYMKEKGEMINLKIVDYEHKVKRSGRVGEDRKAYLPLSDKKAEELGYVPPKKMK
jgi:hypothetical protein